MDGFIARKNGDIDWLPQGSEGDEDYGYTEFMSTVDHIVMGRNSFEKVLTFGEWPYNKKVIVLTSRDLTLPPKLVDKVEPLHLPPRDLVHEMDIRGATPALAGGAREGIYLDGGITIQHFLRERLINEMVITIIPILIGEGLPLFGTLEKDVRLELIHSRSFPNGFVQNKYKVL